MRFIAVLFFLFSIGVFLLGGMGIFWNVEPAKLSVGMLWGCLSALISVAAVFLGPEDPTP